MINALFDHIARYKTGYLVAAIVVALGITVWGYNRVPDFEALELAGRTGRVRGVPIRVVFPNGSETFQAGQPMTIQWEIGQPSLPGKSNQQDVPMTVDIYLRTAGPNSGIVNGDTIVQPNKNALEVARNLTSATYNYTIPQDLVGQWKVVVLNQRLQSIDESNKSFEIQRYIAPQPEESAEANTALAPITAGALNAARISENYRTMTGDTNMGLMAFLLRPTGEPMTLRNMNFDVVASGDFTITNYGLYHYNGAVISGPSAGFAFF